MELYEYSQQTLNNRADLLWEYGEFIQSVRLETMNYSLYSFFGYYVEVRMNKKNNKIVDIAPYRRGVHLEKYIDTIDILKFE